MNNVQIANTISNQIGNGAMYMLGAQQLIATDSGLRFRVRGSRKVNQVEVTLTPADDYTVTFRKIGRAPHFQLSEVATVEGVYCDMLQDVIANNTGLCTRI